MKSFEMAKKGVYVVHFENDDDDIYKIGYTSNLERRLREFKTSHIGSIDVKRFYVVDNNVAKTEELIHWRLRRNRVNYKQEFFRIDNIEDIDSIVNEIIQIMNDDLYPKKGASEEQLRLFVIKILGGTKEDSGDSEDSHMRFDFGGRVQHAIEHNNSIIDIIKDWKLLSKTSNFEFFTAEGTPTYWFTLKPHYVLTDKQVYMEQIDDSNWHYCNYWEYFQGYFQYRDEYVLNFLSAVEKRKDEYFEYHCQCDAYGTISIVVDMIKSITLSPHHKTLPKMQACLEDVS